MTGSCTAVEQTPESAFLIPEIAEAFPAARFVHVQRDGRDVAASLLERGWLATDPSRAQAQEQRQVDDGGHAFGGYGRFWVESEREREFESATEAKRCGWAWRRYVTTVRAELAVLDPDRSVSIRYEDLTADPSRVAERLATGLGAERRTDEFVQALSEAHSRSVGGWRRKLSREQLDDVLAEEAPLLSELGYLG